VERREGGSKKERMKKERMTGKETWGSKRTGPSIVGVRCRGDWSRMRDEGERGERKEMI